MQRFPQRTLGLVSGVISTKVTPCTERDFWHLRHFVSTSDRSRLFTGGIVRLISATGGGEVGTSLIIASLFSAGDALFSPSGSSISVRQAKGLGEVNWLVTISSYCSSSDEL